MTTQTTKAPLIPGLDLVGRGIYLRPRQPYELKRLHFEHRDLRNYDSPETKQTYLIPKDYEVNDSPPMPAARALNQVVIEESWERFDKLLGFDANLAVSNTLFSIDASAAQSTQLRSEEDAYYALRSSFIPLWTVYLPDVSELFAGDLDLLDTIPPEFSHRHRKIYEKFFERNGTHYVKRVWVGGKATVAFSVLKSEGMTKEAIQAGIKASFKPLGEGGADTGMQKSKEILQQTSECTVWGNGGDELKLAALSSLDNKLFNEWLTTIKDNPEVVELEVVGIWTLVDDPAKIDSLMRAYEAASTFTPISAVFSIYQQVYFIRGYNYWLYDSGEKRTRVPKDFTVAWPFLTGLGFDRIDAAFTGTDLVSQAGEDLSNKLFFFRRDRYLCLDIDELDAPTGDLENQIRKRGYPRKIGEGWPGVTFDRVDAAMNAGLDGIYFFRGSEYIRFDITRNRADEGYPEPFAKRWVGLTFDRIDAVIYWGSGKAYFFREDQHIRYDMVAYRVDPGYPKYIIGSYVEDWKFFD